MLTKKTLALIACSLLLFSTGTACGDTEDDPGANAQNQSSNATDNTNQTSTNQTNGANQSDDGPPFHGFYEFDSFTRHENGCDGTGEAVTEYSHLRIEGHDTPLSGVSYVGFLCHSDDAADCEETSTFFFVIPSEDRMAHNEGQTEPGILHTQFSFDVRTRDNDGICTMSGSNTEIELTADSIIVRKWQDELVYDTTVADYGCTESSIDYYPDEVADQVECLSMDIIEVGRID